MLLAALFVLFFVVGPLIFRTATQHKPSPKGLRVLGCVTGVCAMGGLTIRYGFPDHWGREAVPTVSGMALVWFAWIGALAFAAQALRRSDPSRKMRRVTHVIGAVGTTMPWFGLASASLVGA